MSGPHPRLSDPEEPPDGDYARYVEQLLQCADAQRAAARAEGAAGTGGREGVRAAPAPATPAAGERPASRAAARALLARWPLLLWGLFVLLMWRAPSLLPLAIAGLVLAGVGHSLWKAGRARDGKRR